MKSTNVWPEFYANTKSSPPSALLIKALPFVAHRGNALDVGGGALKDSRFLLEQGFEVTDLDCEPLSPELLEGIDQSHFHHIQSTYADFSFPTNAYDLASAMFSLPFNPPETFGRVFESLKGSLRSGGIFCGQFFGDRDEWATNPRMTFHTEAQTREALLGMEIMWFEEREWQGTLANGTPKRWHLFAIIARKI